MNKKGEDIPTFVVVLFFIMIFALVLLKMWGGINTGFQANANVPTLAKTATTDANTGFSNGFNDGIVVAIGILYMTLFITARLSSAEPMFFFINIVFLIIALIVAAVLGNVYEAGTNTNEFAVERAEVPAIVFVSQHILEFAIGAVAIILIGLYARPDRGA